MRPQLKRAMRRPNRSILNWRSTNNNNNNNNVHFSPYSAPRPLRCTARLRLQFGASQRPTTAARCANDNKQQPSLLCSPESCEAPRGLVVVVVVAVLESFVQVALRAATASKGRAGNVANHAAVGRRKIGFISGFGSLLLAVFEQRRAASGEKSAANFCTARKWARKWRRSGQRETEGRFGPFPRKRRAGPRRGDERIKADRLLASSGAAYLAHSSHSLLCPISAQSVAGAKCGPDKLASGRLSQLSARADRRARPRVWPRRQNSSTFHSFLRSPPSFPPSLGQLFAGCKPPRKSTKYICILAK